MEREAKFGTRERGNANLRARKKMFIQERGNAGTQKAKSRNAGTPNAKARRNAPISGKKPVVVAIV